MDTTKIAGYAEMTPEEKIAALEAFEVEDDGYAKLKERFNKTSSEVAEYKRKLKEKQSEQENLEMERAEQEEKLKQTLKEQQDELNALKKATQVAEYKSQLIGLGFDTDLAEKTANSMVDGKNEEVFGSIKAFKDAYKATLEKEQIAEQPGLSKGKPTKDEDEKLRKSFGL